MHGGACDWGWGWRADIFAFQMIDLYKDPRGEGVFGQVQDNTSISANKHGTTTGTVGLTKSGAPDRSIEKTH